MHPLQETLEELAKRGLPIAKKYMVMTNKRRISMAAYSIDEALVQLRVRFEAENSDEKVLDIRPFMPKAPEPAMTEFKVTPELVELLAEAMCWSAGGDKVWANVKNEYVVLADRFLAQRQLKKAPG